MLTALWRLALGLVLLTAAHAARATEVDQCVEDHYQGQVVQSQGKLVQAEQRFAACASEACPQLVRSACTELRQQVSARLPNVTVSAESAAGEPVPGARLSIDDSPPTPLDGRPIPIDPGAHRLVVSAEGYDDVVEQLEFAATGTNHHVAVQLRPVTSVAAPPAIAAGNSPDAAATQPAIAPGASPDPGVAARKVDSTNTSGKAPQATPDPSRARVHPAAYVFGGLGVVAAGSWAYFGISALKQKGEPGCGDHQPCASSVNDKLMVSGISLGVGVASLGAGAYLLFARPRASARSGASPRAVGIGWHPVPQGAALDLRGAF